MRELGGEEHIGVRGGMAGVDEYPAVSVLHVHRVVGVQAAVVGVLLLLLLVLLLRGGVLTLARAVAAAHAGYF